MEMAGTYYWEDGYKWLKEGYTAEIVADYPCPNRDSNVTVYVVRSDEGTYLGTYKAEDFVSGGMLVVSRMD